MPQAMLELAGVRFAWRGAPDCLAIDDLRLERGEAVFLHGPSGCGKSTLLALLAGVLVAREGRVVLEAQDWRALSPADRDARRAEAVGFVFQQFNLLPYLDALDNVLLGCRFSAARAARAASADGSPRAQALRLLDEVGLPASHVARRANELSVGQQQRVAAARALIGAPALVIADEPTSALDAALRDGFMALLRRECRASGSTLVFVSHDERLAAHFDRSLALPSINRAAPGAPA